MTTRIDPRHPRSGPSFRASATPRGDSPIAFLVSTTPCARSIRESLGSPAYSYHFVAEALAPAFRALGDYRPVDHPESRLALAAKQAEAEGFYPVHVAINPLQDVYLSPHLPNIVFPFWEFPEIPDRDFGTDTRQNWARIARGAALILSACHYTADAFRRDDVGVPACVVPIPVPPAAFDLPDYDPSRAWTVTCRHEILGFQNEPNPSRGSSSPHGNPNRAWQAARRAFRRLIPWMNPVTVGRLTRLKRRLAALRRKRPGRLLYELVRDGYREGFQPFLSPLARSKITNAKLRAFRLIGRAPIDVIDPLLPSNPLTLGGDGPVYLTVLNVGDERKNHAAILSAFLLAFRDRPDVTLAVKLVTNPLRENREMAALRADYRAMGLAHRCRIAVVTEFLSEEQMQALYEVTTYYVNASFAEGACLPLMRSLAGGRPAIAPDHSAMADYIDGSVAFVVGSNPEPFHWPHDPEKRLSTSRRRPVWADLRDAFLKSAETAADPSRYAAMARAARSRMAALASEEAAALALRSALDRLADAQEEPARET